MQNKGWLVCWNPVFYGFSLVVLYK